VRLVFKERLTGSHYLLDRPLEDRAAALALEVSVVSLRDFVRVPALDAQGELTLEGFADKRPVAGSISLKIANEQRILYDLRFTGDDGRPYQLSGQRDLTVPKVVDALSTLPASVCDESGTEVGRAMLRFDAKNELSQMMRSIRVKVR
jgi:hypothetical protein